MTSFARLSVVARRLSMILALGAAMLVSPPARGADEPAHQLLDDFVHYTLIARPELAAANGHALLSAGLTDAQLVTLLEEGRANLLQDFNRAVELGRKNPELEQVASLLDKRVEQGRLDLARDPKRIEAAIGKLTGNARERRIATDQLRAAGEFAVPALLNVIVRSDDERLKNAAIDILRKDIKRLAVTPLTAALFSLHAEAQRPVVDVLGEIKYPHAGPALLELSCDEQAPATLREAAARAFRAVGGVEGDLSTEYCNLGRQYFNGFEQLIAYPLEPVNNVWSYDTHVGLVPTPVPTAIFTEVMAMRHAVKALALDKANAAALSLFVAANLKRENDLPADSIDPLYGSASYSPEFYATVFGTGVCLDVLGMAIDAGDTVLVRDAIAALRQTTGGSNLFDPNQARQPLLEGLNYPNRRVQYDTALTLAEALPIAGFAGDFAVVPLLASAVRAGDQSFVVLVADDGENRRGLAGWLGAKNYTVVGQPVDPATLEGEVAPAPGVDVVVVRLTHASQTQDMVEALRLNPKTTGAPVLIVAEPVEMPQLQRDFEANPRIKVASTLADEAAFGLALEELIQVAAGGRITEADAEAYAIDAMGALKDIAISGNKVYNIADAEASLVDALAARSGGTRLLVADILALMDSQAAQRKLFDAALASAEDEQIELLNRVAESVKRYGNRSEQQHIDGVLDLVAGSTGATAEAAARVHGALNLPSEAAIDLLPRQAVGRLAVHGGAIAAGALR